MRSHAYPAFFLQSFRWMYNIHLIIKTGEQMKEPNGVYSNVSSLTTAAGVKTWTCIVEVSKIGTHSYRTPNHRVHMYARTFNGYCLLFDLL